MTGIAGDPEAIRASVASLGQVGVGMTEVAAIMVDLIGVGSNIWTGHAARCFSAAGHLAGDRMAGAGRAYSDVAEALSIYSSVLALAQQEWEAAEAEIQRLEEQEHALSRLISTAVAENQRAQSAHDTAQFWAMADNRQLPSAPEPINVGPWQDQMTGVINQVARCRARMQVAEDAVRRSAGAAAQVVDDAAAAAHGVTDTTSAAGDLGYSSPAGFGEQFLSGMAHFVGGIADTAATLNPLSPANLADEGRWVHAMEGMGYTLTALVNYSGTPAGWVRANGPFLARVVDLKDLRSGNVGRWAGDIAPQVVVMVATGGGGAAASATADGADAVVATADAAGGVNAAGVAADGSAALGDAGGGAGAVHDIPPPLSGDNLPTSPLQQRYLGENSGDPKAPWGGKVHYMSPAETEAHRVFVDSGGLLRNASDGSLVDTSAAATAHSGEGQAIFVMDRSGNLYVSPEQVVGQLHHSSLLAGGDVAGAGELRVENGVLKMLTDKSGHYRPLSEMNDRVLSTLEKQGLRGARDVQRVPWK